MQTDFTASSHTQHNSDYWRSRYEMTYAMSLATAFERSSNADDWVDAMFSEARHLIRIGDPQGELLMRAALRVRADENDQFRRRAGVAPNSCAPPS